MTDEEWEEGWARAIAMRLGGKALTEVDAEGNRLVDDDLFLLLNGHRAGALLPAAGRRRRVVGGRRHRQWQGQWRRWPALHHRGGTSTRALVLLLRR